MKQTMEWRLAGPAVRAVAFLCLALAPMQLWAGAEVPGTLYKKDDPRPLQGSIRALPASREFVIRTASASYTIAAHQVKSVTVAKPAGLDAALKQAAAQPAAAIPVLTQIVDDYKMMGWDMVAARGLLTAYLRIKDPKKAIKVGEDLQREDPGIALDEGFLGAYWDALLADGRDTKVMSSITDAIRKGTRPLAAMAHIKRGDILSKGGNFKEALWDGYLRTTEMFGAVKSVQPEALFKAAKCFDELAMASQAERMRQRLNKAYPQSEYAEMLRGGK